MTLRRLQVALDFGDGVRKPVGRLGWDAAARQAVAEWDAGFAADPLPISPLLVRAPSGLLRSGGAALAICPAFSGIACRMVGAVCSSTASLRLGGALRETSRVWTASP